MSTQEVVVEHESGMFNVKRYSANGKLVEEQFTYGSGFNPMVSLFRIYDGDDIAMETYRVSNRSASKKKYLEAISSYSDMPLPSSSRPKMAVDLNKAVRSESKNWLIEYMTHTPNNVVAEKIDKESMRLIESAAVSEYDLCQLAGVKLSGCPIPGAELMRLFVECGVCSVWVLEPHSYSKEEIECAGLLIRLPVESENRNKIFLMFHKLAQSDGFSGVFDDGQQYLQFRF